MSLLDVHSDATAGIVNALIAAEAMRTIVLLMSEPHKASCCEETYSSACLSSIARESFRVRCGCAAQSATFEGHGLVAPCMLWQAYCRKRFS
jgi:hypothetical protein